jgi:hypothetical protein
MVDGQLAAGDRLAVDDARSGPQPRESLHDQRKALREAVAGAAVQLDTLVLFARDHSDAGVFDFMPPLVARGGARCSSGEAGRGDRRRLPLRASEMAAGKLRVWSMWPPLVRHGAQPLESGVVINSSARRKGEPSESMVGA